MTPNLSRTRPRTTINRRDVSASSRNRAFASPIGTPTYGFGGVMRCKRLAFVQIN